MMLTTVRDKVGTLPYMKFAQAQKLAGLFDEFPARDCLELGFFHGVSTAYIAAILTERGGGHLTTIDLEKARDRSPNVEQVLESVGLRDMVTVHYEPSSYTWRMMHLLEAAKGGAAFDMVYIDGGHSWSVSGFGFMLAERLLRPGGWVLLDDLDWTHAQLAKPGATPDILRRMPLEEVVTPQIRKVWELLVKPSPHFHDFRELGQWGFARKRS